VGLLNTGNFGKSPESFFRWGDESPVNFQFNFASVGLSGRWKLRDAWRQKDLGMYDYSFDTTIPFHGVTLLRMFPEK